MVEVWLRKSKPTSWITKVTTLQVESTSLEAKFATWQVEIYDSPYQVI